jgi:glycosyltransferase involved in cell wall biosynthesis
MKVVVCNTHESKGGAAKAANRIADSLKLNEVDVSFLALEGEDVKKHEGFLFRNTKFFWSRLEQYQKILSVKDFSLPFSASQYSLGYVKYIEELNPDIIHLNYINNGLFSIKDVSLINRPIVWTLHDSWAFSGGCHLPLNCRKFEKKCGDCPILNKGVEKDLSRHVWNLKNRYWKKLNLVVVCPSGWLADCARKSSLFKNFQIETISNPLDIDIFTNMDKFAARQELGLSGDKKYILFGAVDAIRDKNKGFDFLKDALEGLKTDDVRLLVFGSRRRENFNLSIPVKDLGFITSEKELAKVYSAADMTIIPSVSENQPNIAIESLACGTPIVGFGIDGLKEIVVNEELGLLAKPYDSDDLRIKIDEILSKEFIDREFISNHIKENFNFAKIGKRYKDLFESILKD